MMTKLDQDAALDASARVNTRENARLTFDQKVEDVIQEIVDSNFDLYKRITDDRVFGESIKNLLFDIYLRSHRQAAELLKQRESKTLEFKSTLRWNLKENRKDPAVTNAVIKTIAAFINTEGGDVLIGVSDDLRCDGKRTACSGYGFDGNCCARKRRSRTYARRRRSNCRSSLSSSGFGSFRKDRTSVSVLPFRPSLS